MPSPSTGILTFDDPAGTLSPAITARDFADSPLGKAAAMKLDGMRTRFFLDKALIAGTPFRAEISYSGQQLSRLELFLLLPTDAKGWDGWSAETEKHRKQSAEAWAAALFARPLEIQPINLDGEKIVPFETTWETPRYLPLPFGTLLSWFDSKAGFSGLAIDYTLQLPPK